MAWFKVLLTAPLMLVAAFAVDTCIRLARNYAAARTIGVPIRMIPISPLNPFWALFDKKILRYLRKLPGGDNSFTRYNWRGWEVADRYRSHAEMGDLWVLVTPLKNWIYVNDPDALMSVFRRGSDFPRPVFINEMLNVFGPNISTAEGASWKTQRRVATHCFNEQNNGIVWREAISLAGDMLKYWTSKKSVDSAADDLRTLSLLTLSRAGFGKSFKFEGKHESKKRAQGDAIDYKESLQTVLENLVLILGLGSKFLANPWLPKKLRLVHEACEAFQKYMTSLYEEEKRLFTEGKTTNNHTLMTMLIRASQGQDNEEPHLTEKEIYGNMFTFNFAGHDTTAHTFTFAMYFLATHPQVQDWLCEEIREVVGDQPSEDWNYRSTFPRLKRCLAVMYETLRLYTIVPPIKWTENTAQSIQVNGKRYILPPDSMIAPSYGSVQTDPRFWGQDSLKWRPQRWVTSSDGSGPGSEEFKLPVRGAFVAWSEGTRDCPGRKFSQVEFVATVASLFRDYRVDPATGEGENMEAARHRVEKLIEEDSGPVLLLQMRHPDRAPLVWKKRDV